VYALTSVSCHTLLRCADPTMASNSASQEQQQHKDVAHGSPPDGWECLVTMEDITAENYVEYQCYPSLTWRPAKMEQSVIEELQRTQFSSYIERVKKTDCQAELKRLLAAGPPIYIADHLGLPLGDEEVPFVDNLSSDTSTIVSKDTHIVKLWFASDNLERSAKLDGAVEGVERDRLWEELRQFIVVEGTEPGDEADS
jgi:hypothetical protein